MARVRKALLKEEVCRRVRGGGVTASTCAESPTNAPAAASTAESGAKPTLCMSRARREMAAELAKWDEVHALRKRAGVAALARSRSTAAELASEKGGSDSGEEVALMQRR